MAVGELVWKAASPEKAALREEGEEGAELKQVPGRWMSVLQGQTEGEGKGRARGVGA